MTRNCCPFGARNVIGVDLALVGSVAFQSKGE
jgi:hypothetical protein